MTEFVKPVPERVLVFGAGGHIGAPLAHFLRAERPAMRLRLASRDPSRAGLGEAFPGAEIVRADLLDRASLRAALRDVDGVFVVTPTATDEAFAMTNLVEAIRDNRTTPHIVRLLGIYPEANRHRIPALLREDGTGLPIQHPIAKRVLDDSLLPVTYLNIGATFMDNFVRWMAPALRERRTLVWPERLIPYIAPEDIAHVAGRLFLSDDARHFWQFYTLNNGHDILCFEEVAALMSEVWGEAIAYEPSQAAFFEEYRWMGEQRLRLLWEFFQYEKTSAMWVRNDFVERMTGRPAVTLRDWLIAHRDAILGA